MKRNHQSSNKEADEESNKKRNLAKRHLLTLAFFAIAAAFILLLLGEQEIDLARTKNLPFIRQTNAAFNIAEELTPGQLFSQWNNQAELSNFKEGPIHMSYTSLGYLANTLLALTTKNLNAYNNAISYLTIISLAILGTSYYLTGESSIQGTANKLKAKLTNVAATALFVTSPGFLMLVIEPDFEDSFISLYFIGIYCLEFASPFFGNFILALSAICYPLGAGAITASSYITKLTHLKPSKRHSFARFWSLKIPNSANVLAAPFLVGIIVYASIRSLYYIFLDNPAFTTGGSLLKRAGLDTSDTYYGGILGIFRFLAPLSGIPESILSFSESRELSLDLFWVNINYLQILAFFFLLGLAGFTAMCKYFFLSRDKPELPPIPNLSAIITLSILIFLPQWASVHFRLIARFFAPAMSFFVAKITIDVLIGKSPLSPKKIILLIAAIWLMCLDQLHFFQKWIVSVQ